MSNYPESRARTWQVAALLFCSGCCSLIYQTAWMREFRLVFGASTAASAAVLAIFIGGLGLGGLLLGGLADRRPRPVLFYAQLESIVAISAAATPFLLALVRSVYVGIGGTPRLGMGVGTVLRLVLTALVLAVPTIAMGGTLPAAARGATRAGDLRRQDVAALYGLNTLGAVFGCVAATFFLLEVFGTRATLWLAALVNLLVALTARQMDRGMPPIADQPPAATVVEAPRVERQAPLAVLLSASAIVGFVFFLMELVWYRMLGPLLGGSVFTFGLILAVALLGIGIGGLLYSLIHADGPATLLGLAGSCLLEALFTAAAFALGDRLAILTLVLLPLGHLGFSSQVVGWSLVTAIVVLPPAIVSGYQFPLLIGLFGRGRAEVGKQIGLAYAANTVGAILGSLAGGFGLIPWLSAPGAWRFVAAVLVLLGVAAAAMGVRGKPARGVAWRAALAPAGLAAATILLMMTTGPTSVWRDSGIGAGRAPTNAIGSPNLLAAWKNALRAKRIWSVDGVESSVALVAAPEGYTFLVNGKSDGNARVDAGTQVMSGLIGAALHPAPRRSLVIGLGTGSTAGWLGAVPSMERVDVVELEPAVLDVARACRLVNRDVLNNPRVHVSIGDAREWLLTSRERYDLIASEPSNPFRAGIASLFTREYYVAASDRLGEDGRFLQWVQAYEIDAPTLRTIYATMSSVFPSVETWQSAGADLVLVGSKRPVRYDVPGLTDRIAQEPYRTALRVAWRATDLPSFLAHHIAGDAVARKLAKAALDLNTDDRNVVEFGFARTVGRPAKIFAQIRDAARQMGVVYPRLEGGEVDPSAIDTAWVGFVTVEGESVEVDASGGSPDRLRQQAITRYFARNDLTGAREAWSRQDVPPRGPDELIMLADTVGVGGSDEALPYIDRLRGYSEAEADVMLAWLRVRQRRDEEAAAALVSAFRRLRGDPWPLQRLKRAAFAAAEAVSQRTPSTAPVLFDALREPFAIAALETERHVLAAVVAMRGRLGARCAQPIAALEPDMPWNGEFLTMRRDCYATAGDPRAAQAERDLRAFAAREGQPLAGAGTSGN